MKILSLLLCILSTEVAAFTQISTTSQVKSFSVAKKIHKNYNHVHVLHSAAPSDVDDYNEAIEYPEAAELKMKLLKLCASYDRGFAASKSAKMEVEEIVSQLKSFNPTPNGASKGIEGDSDAPLQGIWRMVWTTALDVLNLGASPVATPAAIYQVIEPPIATNIIDFIPRAQFLLPDSFPSSLIRAEVKTRASKRAESNRVGLDFEAVKLAPVEFLGMDAKVLPPLNFNLPRINISDLPGVDPSNSPGFFDVVYLDDDMLIIQQNAPGGYFVSIKVPDCDP